MSFLYGLLNYLGYFSVLIIFLIVAIIFSKKLFSWAFYLVGGIITFLSLQGNQKSYIDYYGSLYAKDIMDPYWTIYFYLLVFAAFIMFFRYSRAKNKLENQKNDEMLETQTESSEKIIEFDTNDDTSTEDGSVC